MKQITFFHVTTICHQETSFGCYYRVLECFKGVFHLVRRFMLFGSQKKLQYLMIIHQAIFRYFDMI